MFKRMKFFIGRYTIYFNIGFLVMLFKGTTRGLVSYNEGNLTNTEQNLDMYLASTNKSRRVVLHLGKSSFAGV